MALTTLPAFAEGDDKAFGASLPLPLVRDSVWVGVVPNYTDTSKAQVRFLLNCEDEGTYPSIKGNLVTLHLAGGTLDKIVLEYRTADEGTLNLAGYTNGAATPSWQSGTTGALKERPQVVQVGLQQVGSSFDYQVTYHYPGSGLNVFISGTQSGTFGRVARVAVGDRTSGVLNLVSIGHITVRNVFTIGFSAAYDCYLGEYADDRITRLCQEAGVPVSVAGSSPQRMGAQTTDAVLDLLRECEAVDGGILYDGTGAGLAYVCRSQRETRTATLTADVAQGQVFKELAPVDDDSANRNSVTIKRRGGSSVTVTDVDGPLGTATIGTYEDSNTLAIDSDTRIEDHAGWAVHLGTVEGYRVPELRLDVAQHTELAPGVLALGPSKRVDLTNVNTVRTSLEESLSLLVEGWSVELDQYTWRVKLNTSPAAPWRVGRFASESGAQLDAELRAQTDGAYVYAKANTGATSLQVATPTGPLWTTAAADYPLDLSVGGRQVTATACTGASSPQTFTVAALPARALPGTAVELWQSPVLAL
jgi:hypothetical protein